MLSPAFAAAPGDLDSEPATPQVEPAPPIVDYNLDTEMVVQNWVLCVSRTVAEQLVQAREEGVDRARSAYAELNAAKSCGQFAELRVILRERLYVSSADSAMMPASSGRWWILPGAGRRPMSSMAACRSSRTTHVRPPR